MNIDEVTKWDFLILHSPFKGQGFGRGRFRRCQGRSGQLQAFFSQAFQMYVTPLERRSRSGLVSSLRRNMLSWRSMIREGFYHGTCRTVPLYTVHDGAPLPFAELTPKVLFDFRQIPITVPCRKENYQDPDPQGQQPRPLFDHHCFLLLDL